MENGTSIINLVIIIYTLNFDNALYYFNKALNLKTDQIDKASILNNIAFNLYAARIPTKRYKFSII
jgi:hypothetical protein